MLAVTYGLPTGKRAVVVPVALYSDTLAVNWSSTRETGPVIEADELFFSVTVWT